MRKRSFGILVGILLIQTVMLFGKTVEVIYFNDYHGNVLEKNTSEGYIPGISKFMGVVETEYKKWDGSAIIVVGGDNYQGIFLSTKSYGAIVNDMFKSLNVKASAVGNHEFDWGADRIAGWQKDGGFDYLAANIMDKSTGKPVTWAAPYKIYDVGGVKIAFIGISTLETTIAASKKMIAGLDFVDAAKIVQQWIDYLKTGSDLSGKPDVIIALTHIPSTQDPVNGGISEDELINLCKNTKGLDAVLSAHSHRLVCGQVNGIPVIQTGSFGRALGLLKITVNDGKLEKIEPSLLKITPEIADATPSKEGAEILDKYKQKFAEFMKVVGTSDGEFTRENDRLSVLGKWVTETIRKSTGAQIVFTNKFGLRSDLYKGDIKIADLIDIVPFENTVVTMKLKGSDVIKALENVNTLSAGVKAKLSLGPDGKYKVISAQLPDGQDIKPDEYYTVAVNDFMAAGGDGYDFKNAIDVKDSKINYRDVLIDQIKKDGVIKPVKPDDITILKIEKAKTADKAA